MCTNATLRQGRTQAAPSIGRVRYFQRRASRTSVGRDVAICYTGRVAACNARKWLAVLSLWEAR
jgi:hypothetical protein|eukprot:COSAG06_NODE_31_length_31488_cov_60.882793_20_plen_64_part_00